MCTGFITSDYRIRGKIQIKYQKKKNHHKKYTFTEGNTDRDRIITLFLVQIN